MINGNTKQKIVEYLTEHITAKSSEIAVVLDLKPSRTRDYLSELVADDIIIAEGSNRNRIYKLKR